MPPLKIPHSQSKKTLSASTKTWHSQIDKHLLKRKTKNKSSHVSLLLSTPQWLLSQNKMHWVQRPFPSSQARGELRLALLCSGPLCALPATPLQPCWSCDRHTHACVSGLLHLLFPSAWNALLPCNSLGVFLTSFRSWLKVSPHQRPFQMTWQKVSLSGPHQLQLPPYPALVLLRTYHI